MDADFFQWGQLVVASAQCGGCARCRPRAGGGTGKLTCWARRWNGRAKCWPSCCGGAPRRSALQTCPQEGGMGAQFFQGDQLVIATGQLIVSGQGGGLGVGSCS